jgi:hypothetical protein
VLQDACLSNFRKHQLFGWILPTGAAAQALVTTPFVIRIRHGRTFHMSVKYFTKAEVQQQAFRFIETGGYQGDRTEEDIQSDAERWEALTNIPVERLPASLRLESYGAAAAAAASSSAPREIKRAADVPVASALSERLGRTVVWAGNGRVAGSYSKQHFEMDRCFIRDALLGLLQGAHPSAVKEVTLYVPAGILSNGCELRDIPGSNDPARRRLTEQAIRAVDVLVVMAVKALKAQASVSSMLTESHFIDEVLLSKEKKSAQLHVLFCAEAATSRQWTCKHAAAVPAGGTHRRSSYADEHDDVHVALMFSCVAVFSGRRSADGQLPGGSTAGAS